MFISGGENNIHVESGRESEEEVVSAQNRNDSDGGGVDFSDDEEQARREFEAENAPHFRWFNINNRK